MAGNSIENDYHWLHHNLRNANEVLQTNGWKKIIDSHPKLYHEALSHLLPKLSRPISIAGTKQKKVPPTKMFKRGTQRNGKIRRNNWCGGPNCLDGYLKLLLPTYDSYMNLYFNCCFIFSKIVTFLIS